MSTSLTKIMEKGEALTRLLFFFSPSFLSSLTFLFFFLSIKYKLADETVIAMLDYLKKDEYESGSRIDAYDLLPEKAPSKEEE